jgi:hypothetical protein
MTPDQGLRVSQPLSSIAGWESCQAWCDALITRDLATAEWRKPGHSPTAGDEANISLKEGDIQRIDREPVMGGPYAREGPVSVALSSRRLVRPFR